VTSRAALLAELDGIRRRGYALNWEESVEGTCAVAAAVRDPAGAPVAAVAMAAPSSRLRSVDAVRAHAPSVLAAARRVEEALRSA
jgi:DNA-binding IclR family transcriptional regulator